MERAQGFKRKAPFGGLQRRVRARKDEPEQLDEFPSGASEPSEEEDQDDGADDDGDQDELGTDDSEEDEDEENDGDEADAPEGLDASSISLGALAKAQAAFPSVRQKHRKPTQDVQTDGSGSEESGPPWKTSSKTLKPITARANKHAPMEQTSKRAVSRKREAVAVPKRHTRDPRFLSASSGPTHAPSAQDTERLRRNYAFLSEYEDSEMATLRATIKKARDPRQKEELQRALASMKSRRDAQRRKDEERAVVADHRRKEKELVRQGKTPFYLKRSEQKKQLLVNRFAGMKGKQVDKAIERKRKKVASKERRELPFARRER